MPDLIVPDVSEYQTVDFAVFEGPIIVRAHNGRREDYHWRQHAAGASAQRWWGAYQYLPANVDAGLAAQRFIETLGTFRPNVTILDLEEGDGDQQQRQHDWLTVMASDPARDWTYSGDYFARAHGLTVEWVAAYQNREPTTAHELWQFTDKHPVPGIGPCDASVFLGTVDDLIALTSLAPSEDAMAAPLIQLDSGEIIAVPRNGDKPWHVTSPAVLAALQYAGVLEQPAQIPKITDRDQVAGFKALVGA